MSKFSLKKMFRVIGPGLITGASDDDPSGIATYALTGASTGFQMLWTALLTTPLMIAAQELSARIGIVGGKGIIGTLREHFPKKYLYGCVTLLLLANVINIGADLGAMAESIAQAAGGSFWWILIGVTLVTVLLEVFIDYKTYARYLQILTLSLFAYVIVAFMITIDWKSVAFNLVIPSGTFSKDFFLILTAILGTTISPYLFFWQASQEVEEEISKGRKTMQSRQGATAEEIGDMRIDTAVGMVFSNIVMVFIIVVAAVMFFSNGIHQIDTAQQAAKMLEPLAGKWASLLFAAGIVGTGLLAVPVLAGSSAYAMAEMFRFRQGLSLQFRQARAFYMVIIFSFIIGAVLNMIGLSPVKMLFYSAVFNGLVAPIILVFMVLVGNDTRVMGKWTSGTKSNILMWLTILLLSFAAIGTLVSLAL